MRILAFLHGTTIMHAAAVGLSREERVRQSRERDPSVLDYATCVPIGDTASKLRRWHVQGAEIEYLSSHRRPENAAADEAVLRRWRFPRGHVHFRQGGEAYADVVERVLPDVLIEDDCESIGGEAKMIWPQLRPELQARITCIPISEFGGIDHLPDDLKSLSAHRRWPQEEPSSR